MPTRTKPPIPGAKRARRNAPDQGAAGGPLTVAQARAIVRAASAEPPASAGQRARRSTAVRSPAPAGRGRQASRAAAAPPVEATPDTVEVERRRLALQQRDEIRERVRDYTATMALLKERGIEGLSAPVAMRARRRGGAAAPSGSAAGPLQVLAEGDSWFDYPGLFGGGLVPRLEARLGVPILSLAKAGDETRYMLGVKERKLLAKHLQDGCPTGGPWDLMLFSGGGNDIVDEPLVLWLRDFDPSRPAAELLDADRFGAALALVRAAYEDLIALRDKLSPGTRLVFQGYDFPIADGRKVCHLGPWLKPSFEARGFPPDGAASGEVLVAMLRAFAAMLRNLESRPQVHFIDTQGTLERVKASWHNEMHPSRRGFDRIADVMHNGLRALFPGRVLP